MGIGAGGDPPLLLATGEKARMDTTSDTTVETGIAGGSVAGVRGAEVRVGAACPVRTEPGANRRAATATGVLARTRGASATRSTVALPLVLLRDLLPRFTFELPDDSDLRSLSRSDLMAAAPSAVREEGDEWIPAAPEPLSAGPRASAIAVPPATAAAMPNATVSDPTRDTILVAPATGTFRSCAVRGELTCVSGRRRSG